MTGSSADQPSKSGQDMEWQEYYLLNSDYTFIKHRQVGEVESELSGIYTILTQPDGDYIQLSYQSENALISSCSPQSAKEILFVVAEDEVKGTWEACDGPGLYYKRVVE